MQNSFHPYLIMYSAIFFMCFTLFSEISTHGMMLDPPNRASLWRFFPNQPVNYEDNQMFCGGVQIQHGENNGRCGVCGDNWADPQPRSNENTGVYGNGIILRNYTTGSVLETTVLLTANHVGRFVYSLCVMEDSTKPEEEDCFNNLVLADGTSQYTVNKRDYLVKNLVQLPQDVKCDHCVLRWQYICGNSWGVCSDGKGNLGCGAQETFHSCADVSIN